jgi:NodT family efflux transporter outer membrane factor (OMF) lipoprotein
MTFSIPVARRHAALMLLATVGLLSGCAVGPDWFRPAPPAVEGYTPEPLPAQTAAADVAGGEAQRFVRDLDIPGQWWVLFRSEKLNALIDEAIKANPNLQAAQATLRQTQENVLAEEGAFLPSVDAGLSTTRQRTTGAAFGQRGALGPFSVNTASVSVGYAPDVFGGLRRQVESLEAQSETQRFQVEATYLTLTSNVVASAIQEASLRAQIAATQDIITAQTQQYDLLRQQFELGGTSRAAVLAQEATLAQTRATLPTLQKALAQQRNLLSALIGRFPSQEPGETFDLAGLHLPQDLPVSLASELVQQRPDVRASEAQLHAASAQIGVVTASMFPQFSITGSFGSSAGRAADLFSPGTAVWSIGASVLQPLFRGGTLAHEKRAAVAAYESFEAQYRSTVLGAFQNVADTLRALQSDADSLRAQVEAEKSAADSLEMSRQQFQLGAIPYAALLDAQRIYLQVRVSLVQAQASRYADTAALFQALGGGWWNRPTVATSDDNRVR